jgi:hypothetical protein
MGKGWLIIWGDLCLASLLRTGVRGNVGEEEKQNFVIKPKYKVIYINIQSTV